MITTITEERSKIPKYIRQMLLIGVGFATGLSLFIMEFYSAKNYPDQNYPYYSGGYATEGSKLRESITFVSYNIRFAEEIEQAVAELKAIESQRGLDIILLQEMDEVGVEKIARELQLNYVYFPAAVEPTYNKNFGNAILSKWQITDAQKFILPHKSLLNRMNRIATRATIQIHDVEILVYSVHTESLFTLPKFRRDQYNAILDNVNPNTKLVIVGGDFNSFTESAVKEIEDTYMQAGLKRVTKGIGNTIFKIGIGAPSDHIFAKGFVVGETGVMTEATASDHLPIWVNLSFE